MYLTASYLFLLIYKGLIGGNSDQVLSTSGHFTSDFPTGEKQVVKNQILVSEYHYSRKILFPEACTDIVSKILAYYFCCLIPPFRFSTICRGTLFWQKRHTHTDSKLYCPSCCSVEEIFLFFYFFSLCFPSLFLFKLFTLQSPKIDNILLCFFIHGCLWVFGESTN